MKKSTSWNKEIVWGEYQEKVVLPNILRALDIKKGEVILDLGSGAGLFAREFAKNGAKIFGVDPSSNLIEAAKRNCPNGDFRVGSAAKLEFLKSDSIDKITIIFAIQNVDEVHKVFDECARVLKPNGRLFVVMNHPAFRVPKASEWVWDNKREIQYRRVDQYLSESKEKITTHPGDRPEDYTISFHRPLQFYFKTLSNSGFCVNRLEEWISPKKSEPGPRAEAEDIARKEFPLFLFLEARLL